MGLLNIFDIAGSGMSSQSVRLATTASNISNAEVPAGSANKTYKARYPVFETIQQQAMNNLSDSSAGVKVAKIMESDLPARKQYEPGHALADKNGYVYYPNVNVMNEMANMMSASRSYSMNANVLNTTKQMLLRTLQLGE